MKFLDKLERASARGQIPRTIAETLRQFYDSYVCAAQENLGNAEGCDHVANLLLDEATAHIDTPFVFSHYHRKIRTPIDLYQFGLDFVRPLVKLKASRVLGREHVDTIQTQIERGDNVVLFANHQTEPDPQAINLLLEKTHTALVDNLVFVAGHRVTTDPLAVPLSKGLDLLCIYSRNYIEHPPEERQNKLLHNQTTMRKMRQLLSGGGKCIYVAPSGGRDRPDENGVLDVAPFNPDSIEMFRLTAAHAGRATHFYPLALDTYPILPPPDTVSAQLGEPRLPQCAPISLAFGEEVEMEALASGGPQEKRALRQKRAEHIWNLVKGLYRQARRSG